MSVKIETFFKTKRDDLGPIIGIDLGTTHSLVATVRDGKPVVLKNEDGEALIPSVVSFETSTPQVGKLAKTDSIKNSNLTIFSVKRLLGQDFKDLKKLSSQLPYEIQPSQNPGSIQIKVKGQSFSPIEISSFILKELKKIAEKQLDCTVNNAVITVPAYFNDAQRQATRLAGQLAGLNVLRMINEPTAASLAYGLNHKREGLIAVYDLGGGTFDLSILKLQNGIFEVLSTHGDTALGGDDFDRAIADRMRKEILKEHKIDPYSNSDLKATIRVQAEQLKKNISTSDPLEAIFTTQISLGNNKNFEFEISKKEIKELIWPLIEKTQVCCESALKDAGVEVSELSDVVLVGGSTRMIWVQQWVKEFFGKTPNTSMHPDQVVAEGAAIQADILAGNNQDYLLLDVVPLSLGLETYGGLSTPIIHRNTRIPTVAKETFTTFVDFQTGVDIHIVQGEREEAVQNRSLGRFKLAGIEPQLAGRPRVEVSFLIDADGVLQVSAKDLNSGKLQSIEVRPSYGLNESEIEKMLEESMTYAEGDLKNKELIEAKNKAEPVIRATEKGLADWPSLADEISMTEKNEIDNALNQLKTALSGSEKDKILHGLKVLNRVTHRLAEVRVKKSLKKQFQIST